jgi:RNA polymerase sigma-70 factor (ECF subfamily)
VRGWRLAWSLLRNEQDAADVVQQAFLVAVRKPGKIPRVDPWPWLASAIALEARNLIRLKGRRRTMTHDFGESSMPIEDRADGDPAMQALTREQSERLFDALDELPDDEREAICLVTGSGLSYSAAARALHLPVTTLRLRVQRAVEALRKKLGGTEAGIMGSLPLLPVPEPPSALHVSLQAQVSGGVVPGAITIGSIAVKKAYLLWIAIALVLCAGAAVGLVLTDERKALPDSASGNQLASGPAAPPEPVDTRPPGVGEHDLAAAAAKQNAAESATAAPDAERTPVPELDPDELDRLEEEELQSKRRVSHDPEPTCNPVEIAKEDKRVIATIGGASPWTGYEPTVAMVVHPDDSTLFTVSERYVTCWDAQTGASVWMMDFGKARLCSIDVSPDGSTVAAGGQTSWVVLLDARTGARKGALRTEGHSHAVAYAPDGRHIAVSAGKGVDLLNLRTGEVARQYRFSLPGPSDPRFFQDRYSRVSSIRFANDGATLLAVRQQWHIWSHIKRGIVRSWDVASGAEGKQIEFDTLGFIACGRALFSRDGSRAIVPAFDAQGLILSHEEYMNENPLRYTSKPGETEEQSRERFRKAEQQVWKNYEEYLERANGKPNSGTLPRFVAVVNLTTGELEHRVDLGEAQGPRVELATDSIDSILAVWCGGHASMFNFGVWTPLSRTSPATVTHAMAFDSAARLLFASHDARIVRFQTSDGSPISALEASGLKPDDYYINVSGDGSAVVFMQGGELICWDIGTRSVRWKRAGVKSAYRGACDPKGRIVIAVDAATGEPLLLDGATGETQRRLSIPEGLKAYGKPTVGRNGTIMDQASDTSTESPLDQDLIVWQPTLGYAAKRIPAMAAPVGLLGQHAVSDDGSTIAAMTWKGYMIADVERGVAREVEVNKKTNSGVHVQFTPDGKHLLAVSLQRAARVLRIDVATATVLAEDDVPSADQPERRIGSFLVSPDGDSLLLAANSWENEPVMLVRLDLASGKITDRYTGHTGGIQAMDQSADGRIVASLCADRVIRVWRMQD